MDKSLDNQLPDFSEFYYSVDIEKADIEKLQSRLEKLDRNYKEQIKYFEQKSLEDQEKLKSGKRKFVEMARQEMDAIKQELARRRLN